MILSLTGGCAFCCIMVSSNLHQLALFSLGGGFGGGMGSGGMGHMGTGLGTGKKKSNPQFFQL